jgi:hypothetical protein
LDHVTGLDKYSVHASAIDGVDVNCFTGYDAGTQWNKVVERVVRGLSESHLSKWQAESSLAGAGDKLHCQQRHHGNSGGRQRYLDA